MKIMILPRPTRLRAVALAVAGCLTMALGVRHAAAQTYATPASPDYGSNGASTVAVTTFTNPSVTATNGQTLTVSIYHPGTSIDTTAPTIFFSHGLTDPIGHDTDYLALLNNLASRGYNVVFSPYEYSIMPAMVYKMFDEMTTGFDAAVANYNLNTAKVGFVGHSFGGGFLPATIQHEMMGASDYYRAGHTWGSSQAFMFSMAPAYALGGGGTTGVSGAQAIAFPSNLNVVMQAYHDDNVTVDPRLAIDLFYNITTLNSQKDFQTVYGDSHGTPAQVASHYLPATNAAQVSTSLQAWAVFRPLDALADYTFTGNAAAKTLALGNGAGAETYNGIWSDGVAVRPKDVTDLPNGNYYYAGSYSAQWNSATNPRINFPLATPPQFIAGGLASGQLSNQASGLLVGRGYIEQTTSNLPLASWSTANSFVAAQTTKTFTHTVATNSPPQFWRLLAQ